MQQVVSIIIVFYQRFISVLMPPRCRFYPSCSQFTLEAVERFGAVGGLWLGLKRIIRCHPFGDSGYDPVPPEVPPEAPSKNSDVTLQTGDQAARVFAGSQPVTNSEPDTDNAEQSIDKYGRNPSWPNAALSEPVVIDNFGREHNKTQFGTSAKFKHSSINPEPDYTRRSTNARQCQ